MRTGTEKSRRRFWLGLAAVLAMIGSLTFGKLTARAAVDGITYTVDGDTVIITGTGTRSSSFQDIIDREVLLSVKHVKFENCRLMGSAECLFSYAKYSSYASYDNLESIDRWRINKY